MPKGHDRLDLHPQRSFRQWPFRYVIFSALQSTLREMRVLSGDVRTWAALGLLSLVVGLIGPFGTFGLPVMARLTYWTAVVLGTAVVGTLVAGTLEQVFEQRLPRLIAAAVAGAISGIPIVMAVALVNILAFGPWFQPVDLLQLGLYCMLIAAAVTVLSAVFEQRRTMPTEMVTTPALLDRLPLPQRGRLLHLAVADHYVEVVTDRGKALLLLRLSDAIRETAPVRGLQVHRSHWVALDAVRRTSRQAGRPVLELENGTIVPVSRSFMAETRAAGLFS